jgi:phage anti-repressor protein
LHNIEIDMTRNVESLKKDNISKESRKLRHTPITTSKSARALHVLIYIHLMMSTSTSISIIIHHLLQLDVNMNI